MTDERFVNVVNSRREEQRRVMEEIRAAGHCPFCPEHLVKYHLNHQPVLFGVREWLVTPSRWPYEHTRLHLLLIHKRHIELPQQILVSGFQELAFIFDWVMSKYQITSGAFCFRFGEMEAATVKHLHAHIIVPDPDKPAEAKVRFKVG